MADDFGGCDLWLTAFFVYECPLRQKMWAERCSGGGCSCHGGQGSCERQRKGWSKILSKGNPQNCLFPLCPTFQYIYLLPEMVPTAGKMIPWGTRHLHCIKREFLLPKMLVFSSPASIELSLPSIESYF